MLGKLVGYIQSDIETKHDLATATEVQIQSLPRWEKSRHEQSQNDKIQSDWIRKINLSVPIVGTYDVFSLSFFYYHRQNTMVNRIYESDWGKGKFIYLNEGDDQKLLQFVDYNEILFERLEVKDEVQVRATIRAADGVESSGIFVLKGDEGDSATQWFLEMSLADRSGIELLVTNPTGTLVKKIP